VEGEGRRVRSREEAETKKKEMGDNLNIKSEKNSFSALNTFSIKRQVKGTSIIDRFIVRSISRYGRYSDYPLRAPKSVATPLLLSHINILFRSITTLSYRITNKCGSLEF
jgi:hypothetical protein